MLKIWGRTNSVNVKKALWCLEELGLEYERIDAGMQFGVVNTPEYRRMNPNGLVPTLDDDGFILWESHSIVRYLAAKHGKGVLWPLDERTRAIANQWMDWAFTFLAAFRPVFWGLVRTPPEKRDAAAIEEGRRKSAELLAMLDAALAGKHYVAGSFSMGDIPIGCHVHLWMRLPIERPRQPHLEAWFERLCARPAYRKIVDVPPS
ncbi:MAG: glutathione S-transferase N-terminal domain-containing protein [Betaproteobacteria bacterium]|nr:glutathione S-transferase N-terminal domain-containing protein [Betaproteobacteria bacterium]